MPKDRQAQVRREHPDWTFIRAVYPDWEVWGDCGGKVYAVVYNLDGTYKPSGAFDDEATAVAWIDANR